MSKLEAALRDFPCINKSSEWQIDLLRQVLLGKLGTHAQRNALIRIITQTTVHRPMTGRLQGGLNTHVSTRTSYY